MSTLHETATALRAHDQLATLSPPERPVSSGPVRVELRPTRKFKRRLTVVRRPTYIWAGVAPLRGETTAFADAHHKDCYVIKFTRPSSIAGNISLKVGDSTQFPITEAEAAELAEKLGLEVREQ